MPKLKETTDVPGDFMHYCPGCQGLHLINTQRKNDKNAQWSFDGNMEHPTFAPSINIDWTPSPSGKKKICHYFIDNGRINYCGDSTHALKGQSVELPEIPEQY